MSLRSMGQRLLFDPIDVAWLIFLRITVGLVFLWEVCRFFIQGYIEMYWLEPSFRFPYPAFEWLPLPSAFLLKSIWALMGLASLLTILGLFYRISTIVFFVGYTWSFLLDASVYQNHYYLVCLVSFLLIFVPANAQLSLDSKIGIRKRKQSIPAWSRFLLRFQIGIVYFYGGVAKIIPDWLGGEPMRSWLEDTSQMPIVGPFLATNFSAYFFSYGGLFFDLLIVPLLVIKKTRTAAFITMLAFHVTNHFVFSEGIGLGIFPIFATIMTTAFFEPDWPRRLFGHHSDKSRLPSKKHVPIQNASKLTPQKRTLIATSLVVWIAIQLIIPLRHWWLPGDVRWTQEGHRFAWRMRLVDKQTRSSLRYQARDRSFSGNAFLHKMMPKWQEDRVATDPRMMHSLANQLGTMLEKERGQEVAVYAYIYASVNQRPFSFMILQNVDLTKVSPEDPINSWVPPMGAIPAPVAPPK